MDKHRRNWILGRSRVEPDPVKLPWLLAPEGITDQCSGCHICLDSCPEQIIVANADGFPTVDFTLGECTFCRRCAQVCPEGLFSTDESSSPWTLRANVDSSCLASVGVTCRSCEDACDAGAISFKLRLGGVGRPDLDSEACTGCGACVSSCPANALDITTATVGESRRLPGTGSIEPRYI